MQLLDTRSEGFQEAFDAILGRSKMDMDHVEERVKTLIREIRECGDSALLEHVARFDRWNPASADDLLISKTHMKEAYNSLESDTRDALLVAYERIKAFHEKQKPQSWMEFEKSGTVLGQKVTPVDRAGLYIPGGKAAYPSSLLMNAIPAIVAGVGEIIVCTPTPDNEPHPLLLAACHLCHVDKVVKIGGASAIGAMAYGTGLVPKVDVITGPGNIYVATAKKLVYGEVNIDMIAGPSEIGIIAEEPANPAFMAIDLLSQAEHDEMASSLMVTTSQALAEATKEEVMQQLARLSRKEIAEKSIMERGAIIVCQDMDECCTVMNEIAPEHLEIMTQNPHELLPKIKHAGAIFLGEYTPEPIGDYVAGPNHTLPTGGSARFYSPLSTEHFMKKSSIIAFSKEGILEVGEACTKIASLEGLEAHQLSVQKRLDSLKKS